MQHRLSGFTILETVVVLLVLGVAFISLNGLQMSQCCTVQDRAAQQVTVALARFASDHGRLPCADLDRDGAEDCSAPRAGALPWATLRIDPKDLAMTSFDTLYQPHASMLVPSPQALERKGYQGHLEHLRSQLAAVRQNFSSVSPYSAVIQPGNSYGSCEQATQNVAYGFAIARDLSGIRKSCFPCCSSRDVTVQTRNSAQFLASV